MLVCLFNKLTVKKRQKSIWLNSLNDENKFFSNVLKAVKSNIAMFDQNSLVSSGGQTSRIDSLENHLYKFNLKQKKKK